VWRNGDFRGFGEIGLAIEPEIERRSDQGDAANAGENLANQPAERDVAPIRSLQPPEAGVDWLFLAQIDECARSIGAAERYGGLGGQNYRCSIRKFLKWPRAPLDRASRTRN
jgi:hypothetical protein